MIPFKTLLSTLLLASAAHAADSLHVVDETIVTGSRLEIPSTNTAAKIQLPLRETPLSIGVVDEALIEAQDGATLSDALANISGVGVHTNFGVHDLFYLRGFDSLENGLVLADGAPEPEATFYQLYNVTRVEALKGPGAFLYGGNPLSGTINMLRTRPDPAASFARVNASLGRYAAYRATLDANRTLPDRDLALRLNALWQDTGAYRDDKDSHIVAINPALRLGLGTGSTLNLNFEYLTSAHSADSGLPIVGGTLPDVPHPRSYQSPYDLSEQTILRIRADCEVQLGTNFTLRDKLYFTSLDWPSQGTIFNGAFPNAQGSLDLARTLLDLKDEQAIAGNQLEGLLQLNTGGLDHQLLFGLEVVRHIDDFTLDVALLSSQDLFTLSTSVPANLAALFPPEAGTDSLRVPLPDQATTGRTTATTIAPYFIDRIRLNSQFDLFLGGRYDKVDYEDKANTTKRDYSQLSPLLGAIFSPDDRLSLYANTGRAFAPPSTRDPGPRDPEQSAQYEVGAKALLLDGKLNAHLALFNLSKENIAIPDDTGFTAQIGDQRARGLELELHARPAQGWYAQATYAYLDAELTHFREILPTPTADGLVPMLFDRSGNTPAFAPEHLASLWAARDFGAALTLAAGARYVGSQFADEDNVYQIDGALTLDCGLTYRREPALLRINIENVTSAEYETRGFGAASVIPATPLTFRATLGYSL